jgi:L-xylulokinase
MEMFLTEEKQKAKESDMNVFEYCNKLAEKVTVNEQNIIFLPYVFRSNYNPQAKASFIGLDSHHARPQIIRAVLEGIVFCHKVHLEKLLVNLTKTQAVRFPGGAANSLFLVQIFADVFNVPVEIVDTKELGTLDCAMSRCCSHSL